MAFVFIIASIIGQVIALVHATQLARQKQRPGWIMLAIAVGLMLARRGETLYATVYSGRSLDPRAEFIALLISISMAVGFSWLRFWNENSRPEFAGYDQILAPMERLKKQALLLGLLALGCMVVLVYFSYAENRGSFPWVLGFAGILVVVLPLSLGLLYRVSSVAQASAVAAINRHQQTERALQQDEHAYRTLVETSEDLIWSMDRQGRITFVNAAVVRMIGYEPAEILGHSFGDFQFPEQAERARATFARIMTGESFTNYETTARHRSGARVWLNLNMIPLRDAQGACIGATGTAHDITDRKQSEIALRESEERYRRIVETAGEGIWLIDEESRTSFVNPRMAEMLGYAAAEMQGRPLMEFIGEEWRATAETNIERRRQGISEQHDFKFIRKDGSALWGALATSPILDASGSYAGALAMVTDITERKRTVEALRESEERFRLMIDHSPEAIVLLDLATGKFSLANAAAEKLFKLSVAELLRRGPIDLSPPLQADGRPSEEKAREYLAQAAAGETPVFDWLHRDARGNDIPCEVSLLRLKINERQFVLGNMTAMTRRKEVEKAIRESEAKFHAVYDQSPLAIVLTDVPDCRVIDANVAAEEMLGRTLAEMRGLSSREMAVWTEPERHDRYLELLLRDGSVNGFEAGLRRKDGVERTVVYSGRVVHFGSATYVLNSLLDITDRKQAEEAAQHLANFPELNPNPVLEFTADGTMSYHNPAALSMAELVGFSNLADLLPPQVKEIVAECLASGKPLMRLETRQGEHTLSWSFYPISDQQVVHCYVGDISKRLQLEEQFRQAQKMEAIGQLSGGVAHDFNNLLTVILGNLGLLQSSGQVSAEVAEPLQAIGHAANRAANLTRQLLAFSRQQVMQQENLDLNAVVGQISKMLRRVIGEVVKIRLDYSLQALPIHADQGMLEQVILNLCINARDAMPQGGQLILRTAAIDISEEEARLMVAARAGSFAMLIVTDTGIGIAPENMKRVFEPFFTTKEVGKGTGLGLASVYGIAQQHNGWVTVESELGRGTTFTLFLPLVASPSGTPSGEPAVEKIPRGTETILLVEDDLAVQTVTKITLQRLGYQVLVASNGQQALQVWHDRKAQIRLVLTDMIMPEGLSGRDIARQFKRDVPDIRIVFMSGYSADLAGTDFAPAEGDQFLGKPFEMHALATIVRKSLDTVRRK